MTLIEELTWRGMLHDITPGADKKLIDEKVTVYAGFDPTAASLQLGNLLPIMLLLHFQRAGHTPIALVGGATGMIGDPSGKSEERVLLPLEAIRHNIGRFKTQLTKFLDFGPVSNAAEIVDNYDWFKDLGTLDFLRDVGKHLTVNYMLAKESVKQRLEAGISFTEFSYQLLQAYDFYRLFTTKRCTFQVGGSDQWGNITSGAELVRRKAGGEAFALTCPLLTKADGTKFGKSEGGEKIWLDPAMTSPYRFYQFWLNCSDEDAARFIKIFTLLTKDEVEALGEEHGRAPHLRPLQKALAKEITIRVHSEEEYRMAMEASDILFGEGTTERLSRLPEAQLLAALEGVACFDVPRSVLDRGIAAVELLAGTTSVFASRGEMRRLVASGGVSVNKQKITDPGLTITSSLLLNGRYLLVQKGKKNHFLIKAV